MNTNDIKKQIIDKSLDKWYIFTGQEIEIQNVYVNQLAKVSGLTCKRVDTVESIIPNLNSKSLIRARQMYVVRDDVSFMRNDKLWSILDKQTDNIIILLYTSIDKRSKFYTTYKSKIVTFDYLADDVLCNYVIRLISLSKANALKLIHICNNDYGRILLEIDKIKNYADFKAIEADKAFEELLKSKAIYIPPQDAIFDFTDAVLRRNILKAYSLLDECRECGEQTMPLLTVLYNNAKQVLQVQTCTSDDVVRSTGLSYGQVKFAQDKARYYSTRELMQMLDIIKHTHHAIITGYIDEQYAIEYILARIR